MENEVGFLQAYNAENRLASVKKIVSGSCAEPTMLSREWDFGYDGHGVRVSQTVKDFDGNGEVLTSVLTVYFMGGLYEETDGAATKYYAIAGMTVAMKDSGGVKYLLTDHLGSVQAVTDADGTVIGQQRYLPFGEVRTDDFAPGAMSQTDLGYTGQRDVDGLGLMDYHARFYDSSIGRFVQPDTIIPNPGNPQSWNRYTYVVNEPVGLADPTGQYACEHADECSISDWVGDPSGNDEGGQEEPDKPIQPAGHDWSQEQDVTAALGLSISAWRPPTSWNQDPLSPDYHSVVVNVFAFVAEFTEDRYGQHYFSGGFTLLNAKALWPFGISVYGGAIGSGTDTQIPGPASTQEFLTGLSVNASAGLGPGSGFTFVPGVFQHWEEWVPELYGFNNNSVDTEPYAFEAGFYSPQAGLTATIGFLVP